MKNRGIPKLDQALSRMLKAFREAAPRTRRTLAAVSGGPASMTLLPLLAEVLPPGRLAVAHVNHRTRGKASDRDEAMVRATARRLGLACLVERLPKSKKFPSEDTLRKARYLALEHMALKNKAECIALAHTADDQAETVLLRITRGTGLNGLSGIPAQRPLGRARIVRPLLSISKADLLRYLQRHRIRFATDASNRSLRYARNRVRHRVMPELMRLNPKVVEALVRLSGQAAAASEFLGEAACKEARRLIRRRGRTVRVDLEGLQRLHPALRPLVWQEACPDLEADHLKALESLRGELALPGGFRARVEGGFARLAPRRTGISRGPRKG